MTGTSSVTPTPAFVAGLKIAVFIGPFGTPAAAFAQFAVSLQSPPAVADVHTLPFAAPAPPTPAIVTTTAFMPSQSPPSATVTCWAEIVAVCASAADSVKRLISTSGSSARYTSAVYVPSTG